MARAGDFEPNEQWFDNILRTAPVEQLVEQAGQRTLAIAKARAPRDTGDYANGLHLEHRESTYRRVTEVVGDDPKTLLIESKTGNLARAVKAAKQ